jgi:hypothetical protein
MIVCVNLAVDQFDVVFLLKKCGDLILLPLSPYQMGTFTLRIFSRLNLLADETLLSFSMPPTTAFNDLSYSLMIVAHTDEELKVIRSLLWLRLIVFMVEDFVKLLHEFEIDRVQEIWFS